MSKPRQRQPFQPDVVRGDDPAALAVAFAAEAGRYLLEWRCVDCAYFRGADQTCTTGWPNAALLREPPSIFDPAVGRGREPIFCKAFEALGS